MTHPFIKKDWTEFKYQTKKIDELLDTERQKLVDYAQSKAPRQGYMNRMNWLLGTIAKYKAATEEFLDAISTLNQLENSQRIESEHIREVKKQNSLLRKYITSLGKNPNDVMWMNESDFRELKYQI